MRSAKSLFLCPILGVLVLLATSCETADQRPASAAPPVQALAPSTPVPIPAEAEPMPAPPAPKDDPLTAVITNAESEYQAGVAISETGSPEAAKQNFDNAIKILQQAPPEVKTDGRFQAELKKLTDAENSVEADTAAGTDDAEQQPAKPAPIDE